MIKFKMLDWLKAPKQPVKFDTTKPGFFELLKNFLWGWLKYILFINFIVFTLFTRITGIYSGSMTPTVQTNEIVAAAPMSYGFAPINFSLWFKNTSKIINIKPKPGECVAFFDKHNYNMVFCKRIVAGPGDTVKVSNGVLIINHKPVLNKYIGQYTYMENEKYISSELYESYLPKGINHRICRSEQLGSGFQDHTPEFTVPAGHYFCMGDNRNDSLDSRCEIGFIDEKGIIGKVYMVLFSNGNLLTLNIWSFINYIRLDRCLRWIY